MIDLAGRVLNDRYRLDRLIARGGMGEVWLGEDTRLHRPVALKLLLPHLAADPAFVQRFEQEARAAAGLQHPNVVDVYDVGEDGDVRYIVMEYVRGESLRALLRREGAQPPARVVQIGTQLAQALAYAHGQGVVHRDVKPDNVLLTPDGHVKVTDFGIARALSAASSTQTGVVFGSAPYLSPEQARGEPATFASDVYALGVLLFELATGQPPFRAENPAALLLKHTSEPAPPPSQLNPAVPPGLDAVILRALAKEPAQRFSSAADLAAALRNYQALGAERTQRVAPLPTAAPKASRKPSRAAAVAAVQAAAARPRPAAPPRPPAGGRRLVGATLLLVLLLSGLAGVVVGIAYLFGSGTSRLPGAGDPSPGQVRPATATPAAVVEPPPPTPTPTPEPTATPQPPTATPTPVASPTPPPIGVPGVIGLRVDQATRALEAAGFKVDRRDADSTQPRGQVFDQQPKPGALAPPGSTVTIFVSNGLVRMPNVIGLNVDEAKKIIQQAGLNPIVNRSPIQTRPPNRVLSTLPPPDSLIPRDSDVVLDVSQ